MKKLFLHIGFYKTGSTSLQKNLAQNSSALAAQGICYPFVPRSPFNQRWQHAPLAAAMPGRKLDWLLAGKGKSLDRAYRAMFEHFEASGCGTLVLSSEGFCDQTMDENGLRWLQDKFSDFDITVIAYIRRQDAYFLSTYQELIKAGGAASFDFDSYAQASRLCFARRLTPWRKVFGTDRVIVRPFLPSIWPDNELFYDFLPLIGASRDGLELANPENEGLDYRTVEILRQLNACNTQAGTKHTGLRRVANEADAYFAAGGGKQKMRLSGAQCETLRQHFREDNRQALAGSGVDVDMFFPPVPDSQAERLIPEGLDPALLIKLLWSIAPDAAAGRKAAARNSGGKNKRA